MCGGGINFFSVKDFSGTTVHRIFKFGTKLGDDKLYCVKENQPHIAYQSLIFLSIFLSLKQKILSQISQLLLEPVSATMFLHHRFTALPTYKIFQDFSYHLWLYSPVCVSSHYTAGLICQVVVSIGAFY